MTDPINAMAAEFEQILADAALRAGRTMASIRGNVSEVLVSTAAARKAFLDPESPGDPDLTARTLRGGEVSYIKALFEHGLYDADIGGQRIVENTALDLGEAGPMSLPSASILSACPSLRTTCSGV